MSVDEPLRFGIGIRLRREEGGRAYLLVPEGVVELSDSALAILDLIDGKRGIDAIVEELGRHFDAPPGELRADVVQLCSELLGRGFLRT